MHRHTQQRRMRFLCLESKHAKTNSLPLLSFDSLGVAAKTTVDIFCAWNTHINSLALGWLHLQGLLELLELFLYTFSPSDHPIP